MESSGLRWNQLVQVPLCCARVAYVAMMQIQTRILLQQKGLLCVADAVIKIPFVFYICPL